MAKREQITKRFVMLLIAIALALLMIYGGNLVRADEAEVSKLASETDASPTDASTEATTESTIEGNATTY